MRSIRAAIASVAVTVLAMVGPAQAFAATTWEDDEFWVCLGEDGSGGDPYCDVAVIGTITWGQRTAVVSGNVTNINTTPGYATAVFRAFVNYTLIDRTTRTNSGGDPNEPNVPFRFSIGDPNLVGGINRISIYICWTDGVVEECSIAINYHRN